MLTPLKLLKNNRSLVLYFSNSVFPVIILPCQTPSWSQLFSKLKTCQRANPIKIPQIRLSTKGLTCAKELISSQQLKWYLDQQGCIRQTKVMSNTVAELATISSQVLDKPIIGYQTRWQYITQKLCKIVILLYIPNIFWLLYFQSRIENHKGKLKLGKSEKVNGSLELVNKRYTQESKGNV